jgi:hypothetical protein
MSGSMSQNKTDSGSDYNFSQRLPKIQRSALNDLYSQGKQLYSGQDTSGSQAYSNNVANMGLPTYQNMLNGGAYEGLDANGIAQQLQQSLNTPSNASEIYASVMGGKGNNYADAMKSTYMADANEAQKLMLGNLDARAAASSMGGGDRHGIAQGLGFEGINKNLQANLAKTGYDTFNQDLMNKLGIAQQADSNTLARQQMLTGMVGDKNATMQNALGFGGQMQNMGMNSLNIPWQLLQNYTNTIGSPIVMSQGNGSGWATDRGFSGGGGM